jgi:hypothetical protein
MTIRLDEQVALPEAEAGPVWAAVDIRPTVLGRCANLLYKTPLLALIVNDTGWFHLLPAEARAGFLLSPLVRNAGDFEALAYGKRATPVRIFGLGLERPEEKHWSRAVYEKEVKVTLWRLEFASCPLPAP